MVDKMLDFNKIKKFTGLPDYILINGKKAWLCFIQMPNDRISLGYFIRQDDDTTISSYKISRECSNEVQLYDLIADFENMMKEVLA